MKKKIVLVSKIAITTLVMILLSRAVAMSGQFSTLSWSIYRSINSSSGRNGLVKVDNNGDIIFIGTTMNSHHTTTPDVFQSQYNGQEDVFVMKFKPDGTLVWSTFVGGNNVDRPASAAIDRDNNIWIGGQTSSDDFPVTVNAYNKTINGGVADAMIFKLSCDGKSLLYSSFIGSTEYDAIVGLSCDNKGNVWATGWVFGNGLDCTPNAPQPFKSGGYDGLIICINHDLTPRVISYWGYEQDDCLNDISIDSEGNPVIIGFTMSQTIPATGGYQSVKNKGRDAVILKLDQNTALPVWLTYFGGNFDDTGLDITIDKNDAIDVYGFTSSTDFPTSANCAFPHLNGGQDYFLSQFSSAGQLNWSTYLGGSNDEGYVQWYAHRNGITTDKSGNIFAGGTTKSIDIPVIEPYQKTLSGNYDAFISKFNSDGRLLASTYLGGTRFDAINKIALLNDSCVVVSGQTESIDYPVTDTLSTAQYGNGYQAFISVFGFTMPSFVGKFDCTSKLDACNKTLMLSITSKYKFDYSIINSTNAHIEETYRDDLKIIFDISAINPWSKVFWTIEYKDVYGNTNTVSDSLGISSLYSFRVPTQYIDFDTVQTNQVFIKNIMLYNDADISIEINEPTLLFNSVFSLSSSDFPLTIPAHDSAQIKIYYAPATSYRTDRDTLYIASPCNKQVIPLSGFAETTDYTVETRCGLEITNSTKPIGYTHNKVEIIPNPIIGSGTIKVYGDGKAKVKISIYDETGRIVRDLYQGIIDKSTEIPFKTGNLPTGLYLAVVDIEGEIFQKVFFINK